MENKNNKTVTLSVGTVMEMHNLVAKKTGGSPELRDRGLLESALATPFQSFGGVEFYPTSIEKGAMLGYSLISNHAFVDGNKRIGMLAMLTFLKLNGTTRSTSSDDLIQIGLGVAAGEIGYEELLNWIKEVSEK